MAECPHGHIGPHGEPGSKFEPWCAGSLGRMAEPWRHNLEFQMNSTSLFKEATEVQPRYDRIEDGVVHVDVKYRVPPKPEFIKVDLVGKAEPNVCESPLLDSLKNFEPVMWWGRGGHVHFYDVPLYYSVVEDLGFDPANPVDTGATLDA